MAHKRKFTEEEIDYIRRNNGKIGKEKIGKELGISKALVRVLMVENGIESIPFVKRPNRVDKALPNEMEFRLKDSKVVGKPIYEREHTYICDFEGLRYVVRKKTMTACSY